LGGNKVLDFWQETQKDNFHFCYINTNKNIIINCVEALFSGNKATMFTNNYKFIIHPATEKCITNSDVASSSSSSLEQDIYDYIAQMYPKNKHLKFTFKFLIDLELINSNLFFVPFPNIHIADFCSFINNRFSNKNTKPNATMIKLCRHLQQLNIKMPKIAIKNPIAQKYLT